MYFLKQYKGLFLMNLKADFNFGESLGGAKDTVTDGLDSAGETVVEGYKSVSRKIKSLIK